MSASPVWAASTIEELGPTTYTFCFSLSWQEVGVLKASANLSGQRCAVGIHTEIKQDIAMSFDDWVAVICAVGLTGFGVYCVWQTSDWEIDRRRRKSRQAKIHQDLDQLRPDHPQYWSRLLDLNDT
jgi:hypothetical protein